MLSSNDNALPERTCAANGWEDDSDSDSGASRSWNTLKREVKREVTAVVSPDRRSNERS
jgi:hypothetical protein